MGSPHNQYVIVMVSSLLLCLSFLFTDPLNPLSLLIESECDTDDINEDSVTEGAPL